ncbi:hypothetical protein WJX82_000676 [Trebouxia sp. C0006]
MNMLQTDTPVLCDYLQMAAHILKHYKLPSFQEADPKRIVIATRKESESRRLLGAEGVAARLSSMGYNVTMATMGDLSFEQQLHLVADVKALVGVHGSDLVSMLFMPFRAAIVEIFPTVMGVPAYNPELANQARNYGKVLRSYYSPFNATLYMDEATGKPVDAPPVRQSRLVPVDEGGCVAAIQGTIKASDETMFQGLEVAAASTGLGIVCRYDRPVPSGILYGCDSPQYQGC